MKSLAIANQKGGVGKTTLATHLAWHLAEQGKSVLFVDIDPQSNATSTLASHAHAAGISSSQLFEPRDIALPSPAAGEIVLVGADSKLVELDSRPHSVLSTFNQQVRAMAAPFDYLIVDVPPSLGNRMLASLLATDALLCPIEPEKYAIDGVATMIATFRQAQQLKATANRGGKTLSPLADARGVSHEGNSHVRAPSRHRPSTRRKLWADHPAGVPADAIRYRRSAVSQVSPCGAWARHRAARRQRKCAKPARSSPANWRKRHEQEEAGTRWT